MERENPISSEQTGDKQVRWDEMAKKVDSMADKLDEPVDEGIKTAVIALNLLDLPTDSSCEGHLDEGGRWPYVDVVIPGYAEEFTSQYRREPDNQTALEEIDQKYTPQFRAMTERVDKLLEAFYQDHSCDVEFRIIYDNLAFGSHFLANKMLIDYHRAMRQRTGGPVDDYLEPTPEQLSAAQVEMTNFAEFLRSYYFAN